MKGNKIFPNDIFRDKNDHQGLTVAIGCEFFAPYMGGRGYA